MDIASDMKQVRRAYHAGSWYTNDTEALNAELSQNLNKAGESAEIPPKVLKAIIGPHAGFRFSGPNAAWAYKNIKDANMYDTVFILGPSHKVGFDFVAPTGCDSWETPLGALNVDNEKIQQLVNN